MPYSNVPTTLHVCKPAPQLQSAWLSNDGDLHMFAAASAAPGFPPFPHACGSAHDGLCCCGTPGLSIETIDRMGYIRICPDGTPYMVIII